MALTRPTQKNDIRFDEWVLQLWKYIGNPATLPNFADDAAAAAGGVKIGDLYRNGSALMVRVS